MDEKEKTPTGVGAGIDMAASDVVKVLANYRIPISLIDEVFGRAKNIAFQDSVIQDKNRVSCVFVNAFAIKFTDGSVEKQFTNHMNTNPIEALQILQKMLDDQELFISVN